MVLSALALSFWFACGCETCCIESGWLFFVGSQNTSPLELVISCIFFLKLTPEKGDYSWNHDILVPFYFWNLLDTFGKSRITLQLVCPLAAGFGTPCSHPIHLQCLCVFLLWCYHQPHQYQALLIKFCRLWGEDECLTGVLMEIVFFLDAIYFASVMVWAMKLFFEVYGWVSLAHQEKWDTKDTNRLPSPTLNLLQLQISSWLKLIFYSYHDILLFCTASVPVFPVSSRND